MKPIYKKYITRVGLIWAGCFILFLFAYMVFLAPQRKNKRLLAKQLAEKQQIYISAQKAAQEETKIWLREQIGHLQNGLSEFVTDFEDSANLTFDISQIANEKKVASFSIKTKDGRTDSAIPKYNYIREGRIDIHFNAGFNQFAGFISALERHRPVVFIDKFSITRSDRDNSAHKVNMSLVVFVRKRQES